MEKLVLKGAPPDAFLDEGIGMIRDKSEFTRIAISYTAFVILPQVLAQRLRKRGDSSASLRDFDCGCPTIAETDRPHCQRLLADCRFEGERLRGVGPLRRMLKTSPSQKMLIDSFLQLAWTYKNASPDKQAELLTFMSKAIENQKRRVKKRRPGPFLIRRTDEAAARRKIQNGAQPGKGRR